MVASAVILLVQILHHVVPGKAAGTVNRAFPGKQRIGKCALKHTDLYQQVRYGDFRGAETTRRVLKPDSRRNAVNRGFFGDCGR